MHSSLRIECRSNPRAAWSLAERQQQWGNEILPKLRLGSQRYHFQKVSDINHMTRIQGSHTSCLTGYFTVKSESGRGHLLMLFSPIGTAVNEHFEMINLNLVN